MDQKLPLEEFPAFHTCNYKIKEEVDDKEFEVEELHHSIDIKEESTALEPEQIKCECYLCGIQFHDKSQLIEHLETQCLEKPFSCEICALRYLTKQQLNRHTKTHIEGQIEESKEKEKSRKEKKKLETEISIGKTRQWIDRNTFENFDYDLTQRKLKKDEDNFFDTSTDRVYDYPSCLRSNGNKSESNISRDEAIDDSGNQHFNIIDIYQHSDTSYPTSANKLSKETAKERSKETKLIRCKFCTDEISTKNFMRHLERQHKLEKEVKEILKYPRNSRERRQAFGLYRNQINFNLYINGLTNPNRLLTKASSYYPCAYCRGLYLKNYLKRHVKTCFVQKQSLGRTEGRRKYYLSHAQTVTACAMDPTDLISKLNVKEKVFNFMKVDEISFEAKKDLFIAHFGESYLRNHKVNRLTRTTCSNKLRELSRLLINYRKIVNDNEISFKDLLHFKNFDNVIVAAREVAGYDQVKNTFKAPTLALHLGTTLKSACDELIHLILKKSKGYQCSSTKDLQTWLNNIRDFKRLVETRWSTQLACRAYKDLMTKKSISLPMVGDVQQFRTRSEKSVLEINREYIKEDSGEDSHESYNTEDFQKNRKSRRKQSWSDKEIILLKEQFESYIQMECYPSGEKLKEFINNSKINRTAPVIKSKLQHLIKLKNK